LTTLALLHLSEHAVYLALVDALRRHRSEEGVQEPLQLAIVGVLAHQAADARHRARQ
jgi:hypothetical protein